MGEDMLVQILSHLENMNKRLDSLENDISHIRSSQTKMETTLTDRVGALFDGWQQQDEHSARIFHRLERIETKVEQIGLATTMINSVQAQHSELLDKLSTRSAHHEAEIIGLKRAK